MKEMSWRRWPSWRTLRYRKACTLLLGLLVAVHIFKNCYAGDVIYPTDCTSYSQSDPENNISAIHISCTKGNMRSIPVDYFDRDAYAITISAPANRPNFLTVGPIFTQPEPFVNLRELHIVNSNIPSIGQYSFWGLQNLMVINLAHNNIKSIGADNFRGLINLTELHLDYNDIEQMSSETFRHLPSLEILILAHNEISTLVPRLFRMLAKLTVLDLSYNPLPELNPEVFKDIQHLTILKCRKCLLRRINTQIYYLAPHIEELDFGENQFKYLTPDEFVSLKKLKKLKMDRNQLSVIVDNMFGRNTELRVLNVARNRLALLAPGALSNLTNLAHIDISYNKIDRFHQQTFTPAVDSLRTINFSGNHLLLNEIAAILQMIPRLHGVGMANLSIEMIPTNYFSYNEHIVALDISWNKFTRFPYNLLAKTKFLQRLDISHNKLVTLNEHELQRLEAIAELDLSKNNWHCDQCSAGNMLVYMTTTVLNGTIRKLKCHSPMRLRDMSFGDLTFERLDPCPTTHEAQMSMIAGLMFLCLTIVVGVATGVCCTRRRTAHYYTREGKRSDEQQENPDELLTNSEHGSESTLNTPHRSESNAR